jgi:hypothetical protein
MPKAKPAEFRRDVVAGSTLEEIIRTYTNSQVSLAAGA